MPDVSNTKYDKNELLVMDLTGPMSVPTWDGYLYALLVVEVSRCLPIGRLLTSKEEVANHVQDVVARVERQGGHFVKIIHTDNGTEFVNAVIGKFCTLNGIKHETTNPYRPEQNGIAERAIAVVMEMT